MAREAVRLPAAVNGAQVVLGRVLLERYRQSASSQDLADARAALASVNPRALDVKERTELAIGLGEALYLEDQFGAAAEVFEASLDLSAVLGPIAHERVLDWWATSLDRQAQSRPPSERREPYARVMARMSAEVARDQGSTPAVYWLVAAARGVGDLDRAWHAALGGWMFAPFARDRGAALRADLDRLVVQALIPERAARVAARDRAAAATLMLGEWEGFKSRWSR
jgi:hypothetical protein